MSGADSFTVGFGDSNRNSSRVLNPPGGISSDIFGTNSLAHGPRTRNVAHLQSSFSFGDAGLGAGGGEGRGQAVGANVYDVFPEKNKRSPPCSGVKGGLTRSEVLAVTGTDNKPSLKREDELEEMQGDGGQIGYGLDVDHQEPNEDIHAIPNELMTHSDVHSTGTIQLPRVGSRNPITGYGIGIEDTREICSIGCDAHNDTSSSGRNTGKRMYNTYNKRSQQW